MESSIAEVPTRRNPGKREVTGAQERLHVLLLEDNQADARLIELMLDESGGGLFELEHVERVGMAVSRLAAGDIDLVLSDLTLPDSGGLDTFATLHAQAPQVPIIVLSGVNDTTLAVEAVHRGAQDFLVKGQVDGQLLVRSMRYAIERKRMAEQLSRYAEELRRRNAQLEADLNMAREIQQIFLPQQYPTFPNTASPEQSALRFAHRYLPAAAVGGDFFDVFRLGDTAAGVFMCDVMGHGLRAALVTAIMRGLVEELLSVASDTGRFVTEINRSLHAILRRTRDPFLATAFYGVVDVAAGEMRFTSAGHPSPILVRRDDGSAQPLKVCDAAHGPALGLFQNPPYPMGRCALSRHDLLLLFTHGLFEVMNQKGEEYGQERLLKAVVKGARLPREQLMDEVLGSVQRFSGAHEFEDDVCIVALEVERLAKELSPEPRQADPLIHGV